ncbi:MAG: hypothetical protein RR376_25705 [Janthinobacterium sp.]
MAQDTPKDNAGFTLPAPVAAPASAPPAADASAAGAASTATTEPAPAFDAAATTDTSSRDTLIGGVVLLLLFVAFANGLVAKRVPPNKANASGWWLFIFLASLATGVVLAAVNAHKFLAPLFMGPLVLVGLVALLLTFTSSRR